jgi:hypothetical protein
LQNTFTSPKRAVFLYSQCDANVRKPAKTNNPNEKPKSNPKTESRLSSPKEKPDPILKPKKSNPIQKTTGILYYETIKIKMLPENIALLLQGFFLNTMIR